MATHKVHATPASGYAYKAGKKRGWRKLSDSSWDTAVITPSGPYKFVGTRMIDGVKHLVWSSKSNYIAQTAASHGLGGLGRLTHDKKKSAKAWARTKAFTPGRPVKTEARIARESDGVFSASICLVGVPMMRYSSTARARRGRRDAGRCGFAEGATPTKALAKAARNFAKKLDLRK